MRPYTARDIDEMRDLDLSERERRLLATVDARTRHLDRMRAVANIHLITGVERADIERRRAYQRAAEVCCADCAWRVTALAQCHDKSEVA